MRALVDPYGNVLASLLFHYVCDRLAGRRAQANARWGRLSRPAHAGKLIWICAGASRNSVRLGVELARAIVARRLDVIVFLTYEAEFPDLIEPLQRSVRIDWCIGAADYAISIGTLWRRLTPFALIIARAAPRPYLLGIAAIARHALRVAAPVAPGADASRRDFSAERRLATNAISDLLGRVQRWS